MWTVLSVLYAFSMALVNMMDKFMLSRRGADHMRRKNPIGIIFGGDA